MCGIVGLISFGKPVDRERLAAANAAQRHRGPDDDGLYIEPRGRVGLAMRRLAIIDLSPAGHQPMIRSARGGEVAIVFNGEIYNYRELRAECDAAAGETLGHRIAWQGNSDTEVLLWCYLLWGADMLGLLDGMFAFAIWDSRTGKLLLARDRFGVKPFYYSVDRHRLAFGSEIKSLLQLGGVDRTLDPVALGQYVSFLYTPGERTALRHVKKLEPGGAMVVGLDGVERQWRFGTGLQFGVIDRAISPDRAAERLRTLLGAAVQRQMVADVPVGAFLSGGLDSSAIVAFARQYAAPRRLQCFTIGQHTGSPGDGGWSEDLPYARRVAEHLGVDLHTVWVGPEMAEKFSWMVAQLDEPQADPAALNAYFICEMARAQGIPVLLSGAGGDDVLSGYRRHHALMIEGIWNWLPYQARRDLRRFGEALPKGRPLARRVARALQYADWSDADRLISYSLWLHPELMSMLFTPAYQEATGLEQVIAPMSALLNGLPDQVHPLNRMLSLDTRFFLADHNLNYTDKMSMAASVEVRVPLLDPEFVNFTASLPPKFKQNGRVGKWIFKRAMEPYLPADVIYRPKTGFGVPLRRWLRHELKAQVDDVLSDAALRRRGIFDPAGVRRLIELDRTGRIDAAYPIFAIMCIETWCRTYVDTV